MRGIADQRVHAVSTCTVSTRLVPRNGHDCWSQNESLTKSDGLPIVVENVSLDCERQPRTCHVTGAGGYINPLWRCQLRREVRASEKSVEPPLAIGSDQSREAVAACSRG